MNIFSFFPFVFDRVVDVFQADFQNTLLLLLFILFFFFKAKCLMSSQISL